MLSFIVPAHNEEHELPATLQALREAGDAAGEPYEIVLVDDASTDATARIAAAQGARVVSANLRQIAAVRNAGARAARGETLFFVDADTRIATAHVTGALSALAAGAVGGSARVALDGELPLWARIFLRVFTVFYFGAKLGAGAFLFMRRTTFEKVGGFDEQYFAGEEVYLTFALKELGRFVILPEPILTSGRKVRMHGPRFVLGQACLLILRGKRGLRRRDKLSLWYDGKREGAQA